MLLAGPAFAQDKAADESEAPADAPAAEAPAAEAAGSNWPRDIEVPEGTVTIYQPQLESFKDNDLEARAAVAVTPKGQTEPVFGSVWFKARVSTDRETRMVKCLEVDVPAARFPDATEEQITKLSDLLKAEMPKWNLEVSLDRLLTMLDLVETAQTASADIATDPPPIRFATTPTELVMIAGKPRLQPVEGGDLMQVINTDTFIVLDPSSKTYYMETFVGDWFKATDAMGPWEPSRDTPEAVTLEATRQRAAANGPAADPFGPDNSPTILMVAEPTELIVFDGEPEFLPMPTGDLLYVKNTSSNVFMEVDKQVYYVVLSGRWFTSNALTDEAKWTFVASDKLPGSFGEISAESDKAEVLPFVAGTTEAKEAALDAEIPQTSEVPRDQTIEVTYDGDPQFTAIENTDMSYATNTGNDVLKVGDKYYCCHEAVWYESAAATGPWTVCTVVPETIYTLPPSVPVYRVTYVRIYDVTPKTVFVGYTPGYVGTYVHNGTVVYGTGYAYPVYVSSAVYYPPPVTFGLSFHFGYGSWRGYGGGYKNKYYYDNSTNIYAPDRGDRPGRPDRPDRPQRPGGGDRPGVGDRPTTRPERPGTGDRPTTRPARPSTGERRPNNVFTDRQGNVHRRNADGTWQQRSGGNWGAQRPATAQRPTTGERPTTRQRPTTSQRTRQSNLNRSHTARQRGTTRTNQYRSRPSSSPSRSRGASSRSRPSGGSRGGGGRGGGGRRR
jgi:hypothetical protein